MPEISVSAEIPNPKFVCLLLGKRDPYAFGLGKRDPYAFGLGKRDPYAFGLGERSAQPKHVFKPKHRNRNDKDFQPKHLIPSFSTEIPKDTLELKPEQTGCPLPGKRDPYAFGLGKRDPYAFGLGKRDPYSFGLGR